MIKRDILPQLIDHLKEKEITLITGARQVGKTYLLTVLEKHLQKSGAPTVYLNLDIEEDRSFVTTQQKLLQKIVLVCGKKSGYVFIDEIQRKTEAGLFLKGLYDMKTPYKFIVSGSGSIELKEKIHESLPGRKKLFQIDPISLNEFINYKTAYKYLGKITDFYCVEKTHAKRLLDEYLTYGGYPKVILAETLNKKHEEMKDIYTSYIERDIVSLLSVDKPDSFSQLIRVIASQNGNLINYAELSSTLGISHKTVQKYLWYLEKTYILNKVTPFFRNVRKEVTKSPVYYFTDLGLRNYMLGFFGIEIPNMVFGQLFENEIYMLLRQTISPPAKIFYWRTRDAAEVDFILQTGLQVNPIEVKYLAISSPILSRSFMNFITKYKPKNAYYIHLGEEMKKKVGSTTITYLPYWGIKDIK